MNLIEPLLRWNRWGSATLPPGRPRDVVARIRPFLQTKEVVALVGPRGAGKSTVMHQLMDALGALGVAPEQLLHVNFEEPGFAPEFGTELLDRILATWREEVAPEGRGYLFLDDSRVAYTLKRRWQDGTTAVVMTKQVLMERLCALVPRPRRHLVTYHGVFAPAAGIRDRVVPRVETPGKGVDGEPFPASGSGEPGAPEPRPPVLPQAPRRRRRGPPPVSVGGSAEAGVAKTVIQRPPAEALSAEDSATCCARSARRCWPAPLRRTTEAVGGRGTVGRGAERFLPARSPPRQREMEFAE